jgi:hypothetical protein
MQYHGKKIPIYRIQYIEPALSNICISVLKSIKKYMIRVRGEKK